MGIAEQRWRKRQTPLIENLMSYRRWLSCFYFSAWILEVPAQMDRNYMQYAICPALGCFEW
jgi:hypothetical protein